MQFAFKDRKYESVLYIPDGTFLSEYTISELEKLGHIKLISN